MSLTGLVHPQVDWICPFDTIGLDAGFLHH